MLRPVAVALFVAIGFGAQADTPAILWINRPAAQPWLVALQSASDRTGLPIALVAELIGAESGFRNAPCANSSANGFGQQIKGNRIMARHRLNRMVPAESIMGSALELRENLDRRGSLSAALLAYGTTSGMSNAKRRATDRRMEAAARYTPLL